MMRSTDAFLSGLMTLERQSELCCLGRSLAGRRLAQAISLAPHESLLGPAVDYARAIADEDVLQIAESVPGYYSRPELERLLAFARSVPAGGAVCEVGVYCGRSASLFLLEQLARERRATEGGTGTFGDPCAGAPHLDVHLIDSLRDDPEEARRAFDSLLRRIAQYGSPVFHGHWMDSREAAARVPRLDLLHIDADHNEGIAADCALYLPKLNVGGVAVFHDYGRASDYPMVAAAVDEFLRRSGTEWQPMEIIGSQLALRRIK